MHIKRKVLFITIIYVLIILGELCFNKGMVLFNNGAISLKGTVINITEKEFNINYIIKTDKYNILLDIKKKDNFKKFEYGDLIYINGVFENPEKARNYKGFNYKLYLQTKNIYGIIKAEEHDIFLIRTNNINCIDKWFYKIQKGIEKNIIKMLPEKTAGLCLGLLLGDVTNIEDSVKDDFKNSDLTHILAVSGAHISYIVVFCSYIFKNIGNRKFKILMIFILIFFVKLTGATPSIMRAGITGVLFFCGSLCYKKSDTTTNLSVSILIILLINKYSIFDLGFQLSYAGTIGIICFYDVINNNISNYIKTNNIVIKYLKDTIILSVSANIVIFPIIMYNFSRVSLIFIISNLLSSCILNLIIFISIFCLIISFFSIKLASLICIILNIFLEILLWVVHFSANLKFLNFYIRTPNIVLISCLYIIIFFFCLLLKKQELEIQIFRKTFIVSEKGYKKVLKIVSIFIIVILILTRIIPYLDNDLKIFFLDIGQGDSTLIITSGNKNILIDGGGNDYGYDIGNNVLLPYLLNRGIIKIDYLVISHFDSDHYKGLIPIIENLKIERILITTKGQEKSENYKSFLELSNKQGLKVIIVNYGDLFKIDKFTNLRILWPDSKKVNENMINNNSIVCKLEFYNFSMIFTGDIEEVAENRILEKYNNYTNLLKSDILKVAHHGSKSSSILQFIKLVNPKIALIGVGKSNTTRVVSETGKTYTVNNYRTSFTNGIRKARDNSVVKYLEQTYVAKL